MHAPLVSIIIPVFNQWRYTAECLAAIHHHQTEDIPLEIVVVNNGSTDETSTQLDAWRDRWSAIRVVSVEVNEGFSPACNRGAAASTAPLLLFLNNDTIPQANWLAPLVEALGDPTVGLVGPKLLYPDGKCINHAGYVFGNGAFYPIYHGREATFPGANKQRDYQALLGACILTSRQLFFEVGQFSLLALEDIDLCLKVGQRALTCRYVPSSVVHHHGSITLNNSPEGSFPVTSQSDFYDRWGTHPVAWDDYRWLIQDLIWPAPEPKASLTTALKVADQSIAATVAAFEFRTAENLHDALTKTDEALRLWPDNPIAFVLRCKLLMQTGSRALFTQELAKYDRFAFSHRAMMELGELVKNLPFS
jgi:GT2 family glycosyltransferase